MVNDFSIILPSIYIIIILMIVLAIGILFIENLFLSLLLLYFMGLLLSFNFLLLKAPDLAIIQFFVGIIYFIIILKTTKYKTEIKQNGHLVSNIIKIVLISVFLVVVSYYMYYIIDRLPLFGNPKILPPKYIPQKNIELEDIENIRNIIQYLLFEFRIFDSIAEVSIICVALVGSLSILRKVGRIRDKSNE